MLLAEIIGLPGSGKTTIGSLVIRILNGRGIKCPTLTDLQKERSSFFFNKWGQGHNILRKVLIRIMTFLIYPRLAFRLYSATLSIRPLSLNRLKFVQILLGRIIYFMKVREESTYDLLIFDELIIHGLYSIMFDAEFNTTKSLLKKVLSLLNKRKHLRYCLYYLNADQNNCLRNFLGREQNISRFNKNTERKNQNAFIHSRENYLKLLSMIADMGSLQLEIVLVEEGYENVAISIANKIIEKHSLSGFR